jgi:energy-coupling factor transporter transmembrane protein EcfT
MKTIKALMMQAVRTSETSVYYNATTRCYNPEDSKLHTRHRENMKSQILLLIVIVILVINRNRPIN